MQARGGGHADRGGGVPLVLPAAVRVHVGVAEHDGHGLGPGRAQRHELAVELRGEGLRDRGWPGAAHHEPRWTVVRGREGGRGRRR